MTTQTKMIPALQRKLFTQQFVKVEASTTGKSGKIIRYFPGADLRCQHNGLAKMAKTRGINVHKLRPGEYVIFTNNAKDKLKMFTTGNTVAYLKMPDGQRLNLNVIAKIPKFFTGGTINYTGALKSQIQTELDRVRKR